MNKNTERAMVTEGTSAKRQFIMKTIITFSILLLVITLSSCSNSIHFTAFQVTSHPRGMNSLNPLIEWRSDNTAFQIARGFTSYEIRIRDGRRTAGFTARRGSTTYTAEGQPSITFNDTRSPVSLNLTLMEDGNILITKMINSLEHLQSPVTVWKANAPRNLNSLFP